MSNPVGLADTPPRGKPLTEVLWISMKSSQTVKYGCFRRDLGCARKKIEVCHVQKCVKCTQVCMFNTSTDNIQHIYYLFSQQFSTNTTLNKCGLCIPHTFSARIVIKCANLNATKILGCATAILSSLEEQFKIERIIHSDDLSSLYAPVGISPCSPGPGNSGALARD